MVRERLCDLQVNRYLLPFPIFKLLPNVIYKCYRPQTWQFYLFFPSFFHFWYSQSARWVGTSRDQVYSVGRSRKIQDGCLLYMYLKTIGRMSEQYHNVHKYLSIILHSCNSEVGYLTFLASRKGLFFERRLITSITP